MKMGCLTLNTPSFFLLLLVLLDAPLPSLASTWVLSMTTPATLPSASPTTSMTATIATTSIPTDMAATIAAMSSTTALTTTEEDPSVLGVPATESPTLRGIPPARPYVNHLPTSQPPVPKPASGECNIQEPPPYFRRMRAWETVSRYPRQAPEEPDCTPPNCPPSSDNTTETITYLLLHAPMSEFLTARENKDPPNLDWSDSDTGEDKDGYSCNQLSGKIAKLSLYDFQPSCQRHKFGLRNYRPDGRWTFMERRTVDDNLRKDLEVECEKLKGSDFSVWKLRCRRAAGAYYAATRRGAK